MKNKLPGWALAVGVMFAAGQAISGEVVSLSTYYPSPFGSYSQLDAVQTLNVGPTGAPNIVMQGANGAITTNGAVTAATVSGTTSVSSGAASLTQATGAVSGTTVTGTASVTSGAASLTADGTVTGNTLVLGNMTVRATTVASGNVNELQVHAKDGKYYCHSVYAPPTT